ncbi:MAG TPA: UDP-N-acetylglucosamine 1-carboxyvinyltransferase [Candidatus Absconditabacterales bacterium]|nr:UDP-N-acetylglucosamine 1-carboxyvinyltransferase [Candidatus Absconditabacterales bacterium]
MFQISYSKGLRGEVEISASKNASLPIVAANYILDNQVNLTNKPQIVDLKVLEEIFQEGKSKSKDFFDLTMEKATKIRTSILLIPYGLHKYGSVKFIGSGGCNIGKRPLDTFDDALNKAGITISNDEFKEYKVTGKPKRNIMLQEFSVTATEALITYLAFLPDIDYTINIYQVATEPHVKNVIDFLNNAGADINLNIDHSITLKPSKINIKNPEFKIISDYIEAGTYFAIGAGADDTEITLKNVNVDDLSSMYNIAEKIGINFKIIDKNTITVNSFNKANYKATKFETRIFPGFPTDLQSIFGTLLTQANGRSKIFETLFEGRFSYLTELENLGADIEVLNPHQVLIIGPTKLRGNYVTSTDLRGGGAMVLAGIMAQGTTNIMNENIILRGYDHIVEKLENIGVNIKKIDD